MKVEITREGHGPHRAGHCWELRIGGKYVGTFETRKQAREYADSKKES